jgi:hypothetical protein
LVIKDLLGIPDIYLNVNLEVSIADPVTRVDPGDTVTLTGSAAKTGNVGCDVTVPAISFQ